MQELKEAEHCDEHVRPSVCLFVYLSVSLFVCPLSHQFFPYAALPILWPWLGPRLATLQYIMYFRFVDVYQKRMNGSIWF